MRISRTRSCRRHTRDPARASRAACMRPSNRTRKGAHGMLRVDLARQAMIDEFDVDQDGEISFAEFAAIMKSTALYEDDAD